MPYKTMIDNLGDKEYLSLSNVREVDCKSLAQALKGSQITALNLSNNNIGCNGLKYLTQVLRDTQITRLTLKNNNILDEGVKYLAESLKDTQIDYLVLSGNKIGTEAAEYLNKMLSNTKVKNLYFDIYYKNTEDGDVNKYISQSSYCYFRNTDINITLNNNKIGIKGAQYLNKTFQNIAIAKLTLDSDDLEADDAQYLAQAFKDIKIYELEICSNLINMIFNGIQYLVEAFKDSHIYKLYMNAEEEDIGTIEARYLAEFLKEVQVLHLELHNCMGDDGMKYLTPALENSHIMYIDLGWNEIEAEGARYLSEILPNSKIISINLCNNSIGDDGARYLADGLPNSQVTSINLQSNGIENAGYNYLIDVIDNTNIDMVDLVNNNIEAGLEKGTKLRPYIPTNTTSVAYEICRVFKQLVLLNPISNKFEFIIPRKDVDVDIDQYVFLFKTLNDNPNSKVHIFHKMCKDTYTDVYHFDIMKKINEFIATMPNKFNTFFDSKLPDLVESFDINYVNLVKQFEDMKQYVIVENLLLHRVLYYYVDENQEILHPYIYKMLDKYSMPLYNEQLEPNKKEQIISYYQSHQEIDGVQEIIDLLGSESFM